MIKIDDTYHQRENMAVTIEKKHLLNQMNCIECYYTKSCYFKIERENCTGNRGTGSFGQKFVKMTLQKFDAKKNNNILARRNEAVGNG